jgi:uncharacterized protein
MTNLEIIRAHYDASARGDLAGMLAPLAADCRWQEMEGFPYAGTYVGPDEVRNKLFARIAGDWDDFKVTIDELLDAGDTIAAVGTYSGTSKTTGKPMRARVVHLWSLRDGQVVGFEQFADTLQVARAMDAS